MCQLCPFIIILIITIVCCVYAYFIYTFCFYLLSSNTHCIKIWHIWVILLRDVGANEREWYQHVEFKVERNWFECLKRFSKNRIIEVVMKEVNVCPTCRLPCVTRYSGVAVHVEYIEVWIFWRVWYSFPEDSALHVFSVVFVCGCNLTLCLREVFFFCRSTESSSTSTPRQDTFSYCNKAPVVMVCFEVLCVKVIPHVHRRVFSYRSCNRVWVGFCIIKWFMYPLLGLMCLFLAKDHSNILILTCHFTGN